MKKSLLIPIVLITIFSCSKDLNTPARELNISIKSVASVGNLPEKDDVTFYPNPFQDLVYVHLNGSDNAQMIISNDKGDKKKIAMTSSGYAFDFSKEKNGTYYCEVLLNNKVYRTYLIKY